MPSVSCASYWSSSSIIIIIIVIKIITYGKSFNSNTISMLIEKCNGDSANLRILCCAQNCVFVRHIERHIVFRSKCDNILFDNSRRCWFKFSPQREQTISTFHKNLLVVLVRCTINIVRFDVLWYRYVRCSLHFSYVKRTASRILIGTFLSSTHYNFIAHNT